MIKVRKCCFETNSSSTHAICIPNIVSYMPKHVDFGIGEYGWATDDPAPEDYLYTAILCIYGHKEEELQEKLTTLKSMLSNNGITYSFEEPDWSTYNDWRSLENGSLDHPEDAADLVDDLLMNDTLLLKYLSGAEICTGNDNSDYNRANELYDERSEEGWVCYWKGN